MYYTYILESEKDHLWYTGFTGDLKNRFKQHNEGRNFSTKSRAPFKLIYYEACIDETDAKAREKFLKSGPGKKYLRNRLKRFFQLTGFGPITGTP